MHKLDNYLQEYMRTNEFRSLVKHVNVTHTPVTLTYALERLAILHTKLFMMEDAVRNPKLTDAEVGVIKRKIDYLNGVQRPRLIAAIGEIFAQAVKDGNKELVREPDLKDYKAR